MSRSRPSENQPNPSTRWFEWNSEHGSVRYYDHDTKETVDAGSDFTFILLDELATVRGWHDASNSGIYANEVRDTRQEVLVVKTKTGTIAEGIYKDIKDRVANLGGRFVANCYIGFKADGRLALGSIRFKGAALGAWMEFRKAHRSELYKRAVKIAGFTEGQKGRVTFRVPKMSLTDISEPTNAEATKLDQELQVYLDGYFKRTKVEQAEPTHVSDEEIAAQSNGMDITADDIPF